MDVPMKTNIIERALCVPNEIHYPQAEKMYYSNDPPGTYTMSILNYKFQFPPAIFLVCKLTTL